MDMCISWVWPPFVRAPFRRRRHRRRPVGSEAAASASPRGSLAGASAEREGAAPVGRSITRRAGCGQPAPARDLGQGEMDAGDRQHWPCIIISYLCLILYIIMCLICMYLMCVLNLYIIGSEPLVRWGLPTAILRIRGTKVALSSRPSRPAGRPSPAQPSPAQPSPAQMYTFGLGLCLGLGL